MSNKNENEMIWTAFQTFLSSKHIFSPDEIKEVLDKVRPYFRFSRKGAIRYFNVPMSFDIETSSFYRSTGDNEKEKVGIMYEWTFGIMGAVIIGRTWEEFVNFIGFLIKELGLGDDKRIIVYIHNIGYEFQFMRKWFKWDKIFSNDIRKPIYALTKGVEFRCSYLLSGYSLEHLGKQLQRYKVDKLMGYLDYDKLRHSETPLTTNELLYCMNDVKVVMAYIAECIAKDNGISNIPLTKTGYVRKYCRNACFYDESYGRKSVKQIRYRELMNRLRLDADEYQQLKRAFQGGFTHANPFYSSKLVNDVTSYDFTSSYPAVMVSERFPMSGGERIEIHSVDELKNNLECYCCLFDVEFTDIQSKLWFESYLSLSRCWNVINPVVNNGRIVSARHLCTTLTEQDFTMIMAFYEWPKGGCRVSNFRRYKKDYLPTDFVKSIMQLYQQKTTLKDVEGQEETYLNSKEMINSCYGMIVTDIVRDEILYDNEWEKERNRDVPGTITKYNNNRSRFLFYPWGVWVTAYARKNLFTGILEFKEDYVYSDTDSIKVMNAEKHMTYLDRYNDNIKSKMVAALKFHKIDLEMARPKTKYGIEKYLGVWDFDGHYNKFKTLGAKRYLVQYSNDKRNKDTKRGKYSLTVAGLHKEKALAWMLSMWNEDVFEHFDTNLYIPPGFTGKMTHTYIDDERHGRLVDYTGKEGEYRELSSVYLENTDYSLSLSREYIDYLKNIDMIEL